MLNEKKILSLVIFSILFMVFGPVHTGWSQSPEPTEPNENEIMLADGFGKVEQIPSNEKLHLQSTNPTGPDQLQKQSIVVNAEQFFITPQTTFFNPTGDVVYDRIDVQEGEMISFTYNEQTHEIVELHLEDVEQGMNEKVYADDPKENSWRKTPKPKEKIIFENGVYRNVPVQ